jgi:hypothetical protein
MRSNCADSLHHFIDKARQATPALSGVAMIWKMDLAMSVAPHFGPARCRTGLSSSVKTTPQSAYTGKIYTYYMVSESSSYISSFFSSEARVYDVVTCIA